MSSLVKDLDGLREGSAYSRCPVPDVPGSRYPVPGVDRRREVVACGTSPNSSVQ